jgi:hypothetical protein
MMADMPVTDRAVRDKLRTEILQPRVVERAIELAVRTLQRERGNGSSVVDRLQHQLASLDVELSNLAQTAARGGAVPAVRALLSQRDQERRRVADELAVHQSRVIPVPRQRNSGGVSTAF